MSSANPAISMVNTRNFLRLLSPVPFREPLPLTESDLPGLRQRALDHHIFMLLCSRLKAYARQFPKEAGPARFLQENESLYLKGVSGSARQEGAERQVISLLEGKGIESVVIRGNALARDLYGDPNCRSSADMDLLVRREDAARADEALKEAGYACDETAPFGYCIRRQHHAGYHTPSGDQYLELHWLFSFPSFFSLESAGIWSGVVRDDAGTRRLTPEMTLIMLLIHHHSHSFRELRILVDILWALDRSGTSLDLPAFGLRLREIGLTRTAWLTLKQLEALWPEESTDIPAVRGLRDALSAAGCSVSGFLVQYFEMDIDRPPAERIYKDRLIARFALDGWNRILRSFLLVLLPAPGAVRALYSDNRTWTLPANYLRYILWRIKDWTA